METKEVYWIFVCLNMNLILTVHGLFRLSKVHCEVTDPTYLRLNYCRLKPLNRYTTELSVNMTTLKEPFNDVKCHIQLLQRYSALVYRPNFLNITFDLCAFFKNRKRFPTLVPFYNLVREFMNIDSCPLSGNLVVDKFAPKLQSLSLPMFSGEYLFKGNVLIDKESRFMGKLWFVLEEENSSGWNKRKGL